LPCAMQHACMPSRAHLALTLSMVCVGK
jgi:hypothetical protein